MATTMIAVACPADSWTALVDGATYSSTDVQIASVEPVALKVATSLPSAGSDDFIVLTGGAYASWSGNLDATEKLYGRGLSNPGKVRLSQIAR